MPPNEVRHTTDFDRIVALPRRIPTLAEAQHWADEFTAIFRRPGSTARLRPWQGFALAELARNAQDGYGLIAALPVGLGKTLLFYLMARIVGAQRAMLVIPAALREKTLADFTLLYRDWDNRNAYPELVHVEALARESGATLLSRKRPDLVGIEECDVLANPNSSTARRLDRFVVDREPIVLAMTGTLGRNSILNYWHLVMWCLRDRAPLPLAQEEAGTWADALDNKKISMGVRTAPGPLGPNMRTARAWYRDRLVQTPGVLAVDEDSAGALPLTVRVRLAPEDTVLDEHFAHFLVTGAILGGIPQEAMTVQRTGTPADEKTFNDPFSRFRLDGQMGLGLIQYWLKPAPPEWLARRTAAAAFVRVMIDQSSGWSKPIDTEGQCFRRYAGHPTVAAWREIKPTFKPDVRVKWLTDSTLRACMAWLDESAKPGILWVGSREFGSELARLTGLQYYANKGKTAGGASLHAARADRSIICSWHANKRGFNLQAWPRQLITLMPPSAKWVEQIIGRSHRAGAREPVTVDVLATSGGTLDAFEAMLSEARFEKETLTLTKKVLRATIVRATPEITESNKYRWARA